MKPQHLLYEKMLRHCCREPDTVRGVFCRVTGSGPCGLKSDNKLSLLEEDPLGVDQRDVCYEYEKVLCGVQESVVVLDGYIIRLEL